MQILADSAADGLFYIALEVAAITGIAWLIAIGWDVGIPNHVASILVMLTSMLWVHLIMSLSTVIAAIIAQLLKHERKEILEISI